MKKDDHKMKNDNFFEAWGNATNGIIYSATTHPKAKISKDVAAGAVVLAACNALVVGYFIFFKEENLKAISDSIFNNMVKSPMHLAFVAIMLVVIAVISMKAGCSKKTERGELNFINTSC